MANSAKQIRNSTAEFLIFASQSESDTIEVRLEDEVVSDILRTFVSDRLSNPMCFFVNLHLLRKFCKCGDTVWFPILL